MTVPHHVPLHVRELVKSALAAYRDAPSAAIEEAWSWFEADDLTPRETEIATLVAQGLSNKEAAERLTIDHRTVNTHLASIFGKTCVRNRVELTLWAIRKGLIVVDTR